MNVCVKFSVGFIFSMSFSFVVTYGRSPWFLLFRFHFVFANDLIRRCQLIFIAKKKRENRWHRRNVIAPWASSSGIENERASERQRKEKLTSTQTQTANIGAAQIRRCWARDKNIISKMTVFFSIARSLVAVSQSAQFSHIFFETFSFSFVSLETSHSLNRFECNVIWVHNKRWKNGRSGRHYVISNINEKVSFFTLHVLPKWDDSFRSLRRQ